MEENKDIKRCPFCGEEIKVSAKKCRYCKNWITEDNKPTQENKEIIMIYTCYPFKGTDRTQYRYVVYAEKI